MKIGIITPANLWNCPYVDIYRRILDKEHIQYDIITWCRDGIDEEGCIQFKSQKIGNPIQKFLSYFAFASFLRKTIRANRYDKLIVFTPQTGIFISSFLEKYYKHKYIFDYRDLSIEQKWYFKRPFLRLLDNSVANVISSPGFKRCLPKRDYLLSHNFDINAVKNAIGKRDDTQFGTEDIIDVLTIGGIRDYSSNVQVLDALANNARFNIRFVGKGGAAVLLEEHSKQHQIKNVSFVGFYRKPEEAEYVRQSTFMNIFYPRIITHDTALSNRFYNSLIYRKPMIVTKDTCQGDYAEKYNVGVSLKDCSNIESELISFMRQDYDAYAERCDNLLEGFLKDHELFEETVMSFIHS